MVQSIASGPMGLRQPSEGADPSAIVVTRPPAGTVQIVQTHDGNVRFDFPLTDAKIVIVDVDLIILLPDGARLIIPGYALRLMDADAPPLHFTDGSISAESVFAQFSDIKISETVNQIKLTSLEVGEKEAKPAEAADEAPAQPARPIVNPLAQVPAKTTTADEVFARPLNQYNAVYSPPAVNSSSAPAGKDFTTNNAFNDKTGISNEVVLAFKATLLGLTTSSELMENGTPVRRGALATSPADTNPDYSAQSVTTQLIGDDRGELLEAASSQLAGVGGWAREMRLDIVYPQGYENWKAFSATVSNVPAGLTILNGLRIGTSQDYMLSIDPSTPSSIYVKVQYQLPDTGAAKDEDGFYETFQLNLRVVATTPEGDMKAISGTQQLGIKDVLSADDAVFVDAKTLTDTLVLWANPPGSNVFAAGGDDTVRSGGGADTLDGGTGTNQLSYELSNSGVAVDLDARTASGGFARSNSFVNFQNLSGSAYSDTLSGDSGNNVLIGRGGADRLDGRGGIDTANYEGSATAVDVNLAAGAGYSGDAAGDTLVSIERVVGSSRNDRLAAASTGSELDGFTGDDTILSDGGADTLIGGAGRDVVDYARSTSGVVIDLSDQTATGGYAQGDRLSGFEGAAGSEFADTLTGSDAANVLKGGGGDDVLIGAAGNDTLRGDLGDDTLRGGAGADSLAGGGGIDAVDYLGSSLGVTVNLVTGRATGGDADGDTLSDMEIVIGSNNADTLIGGSAAVSLFGNDGDDVMTAGTENGYFDGGSGRDSLSYAALTSGVSVDLATELASSLALAGSDTIIGIEDVIGSSFADLLTGNAGDNLLRGADGADTLVGGAGNDTLEGKGGGDLASDTADYSGETAFVTIDLDVAAGSAVGVSAGTDLLLDIMNVRGSGQGDMITGNSGANSIEALGGDDSIVSTLGSDSIDGGLGSDEVDYSNQTQAIVVDLASRIVTFGGELQILTSIERIKGTSQDDLISGNTSDNKLEGFDGADTLRGGDGSDTLDGGGGVDTVDYSTTSVAVSIDLKTGAMSKAGSLSTDLLIAIENATGSRQDDTLFAADAGSRLDGAGGNDVLYSGDGGDTLIGGEDRDMVDFSRSSAGVVVNLVAGTATGAGSDRLSSIEDATGSNYNDVIEGTEQANSLAGGGADDSLSGGASSDQLDGGTGAELLDVQNSYYTARRSQIVNTFEERQATYAILKNLGRFVRTALGASSP